MPEKSKFIEEKCITKTNDAIVIASEAMIRKEYEI